ncbi:MAG: alpha/beta fold hydrolase [Chloroflexi bacterium]|nr:alpha/beta fold hydrolase [Chloroflexota bacterium]MCI0575862.1 alpha/beta fold hydrolase [Chloroflexota bacterium]MCI0646589.1 alpha/beta fold hydrolase [Chloroflexota bacterium]MCI0726391.1 alpha/beta fold hydrolase [Chloroflexota bacterium]
MSLFRRALRIFLLIAGVIAGIIAAVTAFFARFLLSPPRQRLWTTPAHLGMPYEDVQFPARDGLRLSGWFVPASNNTSGQPGPTLVMVHGWPWNRLGTAAAGLLHDVPGSSPVELLHLTHPLHHAGYHVLMFDLRNHGQSAGAPPITFGLQEANDLLGALDYLLTRQDVDHDRIGVIGFSMGANTILYALPHTGRFKAAIAVQPTSPAVFASRYAYYLLGPLSGVVIALVQFIYRASSGLNFSAIEPAFAAAGAGRTPILYIQGNGDQWGSPDNVTQIARATPNASGLLMVDTNGRFGGYQYAIDHPERLLAFFAEHLGGGW